MLLCVKLICTVKLCSSYIMRIFNGILFSWTDDDYDNNDGMMMIMKTVR